MADMEYKHLDKSKLEGRRGAACSLQESFKDIVPVKWKGYTLAPGVSLVSEIDRRA